MDWKPSHPAFERLISSLLEEVRPVYVAGGAVRDCLIGRNEGVADLDIVVDCRVIPMARKLADRLGWAFYVMDPVREIARLIFTANQGQNLVCDISRMRGATIEHDLTARDFTVNAMAVALEPGSAPALLDFCGGKLDLEAGVLRRVSALSLSEDSVRLLRAVRLMVQMDLSIEPVTRTQVERLAETVRLCSPERARDELWKALASPRPCRAVELLRSFGLISHVLPEVAATEGVEQAEPHFQDVYSHTLDVVDCAGRLRDWLLGRVEPDDDRLPPRLFEALGEHKYALRRHFSEEIASGHNRAEWLVWHALFHDVGKPAVASIEMRGAQNGLGSNRRIQFLGHEATGAQLTTKRLEHLRFSRREIALCAAIVSTHMRLHHLHSGFPSREISRRAAFRFFRDIGGQQLGPSLGVDSIMLALADYIGTYRALSNDWNDYLSHARQLLDDVYATDRQPTSQIAPLVDGHRIMRHLGIQPGPRVGVILEQILEAQAAGEISTEDEAVELATRLLTEDEA